MGELKEFLQNHFGTVVNPFGMTDPDVDAFIDCAGTRPIIGQIIGLAKEKARIAVVAVYKTDIEISAATLLSSQLTIKGSCGFEHADLVEAFHNVNAHRTAAPQIVTHHFAHKDSVEAFKFAADPKSGAIKVVIDYE